MPITYLINASSAKEILLHLEACNDIFIPPLSKKVNLKDYSDKLFEKSVRFEAWENSTLIGLVAAYLNDTENKSGYVTNVSTLPNYHGKGIASTLLKKCIDFTKQKDFREINLEVSEKNISAIHLYEKLGFIVSNKADEVIKMKLELSLSEE